MKKIIITWDFDAAIGQLNATYPYNFNFENVWRELKNVDEILRILDEFKVKTCFAITGLSAEKSVYPISIPEIINEIYNKGHEIASHSWRHEWSSIFQHKQIDKSLKRSQLALGKSIDHQQPIIGFVPPHNRPMTWLRRGAFSWGDRGIYPFFKAADNESIIKLLQANNYKWYRVSYKNLLQKFKLLPKNKTGQVTKYKGILLLENHYTGFDQTVIDHILTTNHPTYTISAHPLMFDFKDKKENKENFLNFLQKLTNSNQEISFVRPIDLVEEFNSQKVK